MYTCFLDEQNRDLIGTLLILILLLVEAWLGKTDKVRAGSILELLFARLLKQQPDLVPAENKEVKDDPKQTL